MKEEKKIKSVKNKENNENLSTISNIKNIEPEEVIEDPPEILEEPQVDHQKIKDEKELMEISMMDDFDDEEIMKKSPVKQQLKAEDKSVDVPKTLTSDPSKESSIFKELEGIDFETEAKEDEGIVDFSTETMKFYYLDAWCDVNNRPGEIYLFGKVEVPGKVKSYNSMCVKIENVNRHLFLLPRANHYDFKAKCEGDKPVSIGDMFDEFEDRIARTLKIGSFDSRKILKSCAFTVPDVEIPIESEYLEVYYAGKYPTPNTKQTYSTIAHIFGTNTSPIETFLLERKIKGPCWLEVKNFKVIGAPSSWTKNMISCPDMNCVSIAQDSVSRSPPPLKMVSLNVKCILNTKTNKNEIVQISMLVNESFHMDKPNSQLISRQHCGVTRPSHKNWPFDFQANLTKFKKFPIAKFDNERSLLTWFLSIYEKIDPDVVVTFDSSDCQLDIICNRITSLKIQNWSRIGRLKISTIPGRKPSEFLIGRLICDVKLSAQELIKSRSYDLGTLCQKILKIGENERQEIFFDNIPFAYDHSSTIIEFIELNVKDCIFIVKLMVELNILPLALQITNIAGNLLSRTLQGGRSERNEFLLMHAFYEKDYIVPDKKVFNDKENDENAGRKKAAYAGGLVLEPIKGLYESFVLLMDFNSLYPSIIQEYNICYTTIAPPSDADEVPILPDSSVELGILPKQIRRLVQSRRDVKSLMKNPNLSEDQKMQYNIRQMALKLTANSMYGCLGFSKSRFYAPHLAALVTSKGRDILMSTKTQAEKLNHNVIYGDTDSIMINTNCQDFEKVYKIGGEIKKAINSIYKHVELDIDGVFQKLLLLKKKKYAAVTVTQKGDKLEYAYEFKGLDIVRRDWARVASDTGRVVLDKLLSNNGKEISERLQDIFEVLSELAKDLNDGKIPLQMLEITKQLTKAPTEYADMSSLPHVQVAHRMNIEKNRRFKKGDMIDYIICEDGTDNGAVKRGYHLDELKSNDKLKVDKIYYLSQQIHPVISRLLEPIEGIDGAILAEKLSLDPKDFRSKGKTTKNENYNDNNLMKTNEMKYRECDKFMFPCVSCKSINFVAAPFKREGGKVYSIFDKCINGDCKVSPLNYLPNIKNHLKVAISQAIDRFYQNIFICDNPMCDNKGTKNFANFNLNPESTNPTCMRCMEGDLHRAYTDQELNTQLSYFSFMFNIHQFESIEGL